MKKSRYEFFVLTGTIFCVGVILYGVLGITLALSKTMIWNIQNPIFFCILMAILGGYCFFGILSGVLFTVKWLSQKTLKAKVLLTIFFCVPLWLAMAGIFYSIPYGIYNFIQYRKMKE